MAQNWNIDPKTADYVMDGGAPVETDSLEVPAYIRLKVKRGQWLYAPDANYGSRFHEIKKRPTGGDNTKIENAAAVALQPILDDGRASEITIDTLFAARNNTGLDITIVKQRGVIDTLEIPSLGI